MVESAVLTKVLIIQFLAEFYDQLTSISWLSVRSVQRSSRSSSTPEQIEEGRGYFNIIGGFYDYLSSSSNIINGDDAWTDPEVVTVSIGKCHYNLWLLEASSIWPSIVSSSQVHQDSGQN